jgi:hypothetical protein
VAIELDCNQHSHIQPATELTGAQLGPAELNWGRAQLVCFDTLICWVDCKSNLVKHQSNCKHTT